MKPVFKPLLGLFLLLLGVQSPVHSQSVQAASDGTGSLVTQSGDRYDISGGSLSADGQNLFHSFQEFGLNPGEISNFQSQATIQNILARVVGGNPSYIQGLIQMTGGNSHLFLMNPSGIMFGSQARLDVPASFMATTANAIGFNQGWLNAIGENSYAELVGPPGGLAFMMAQPGAIVNRGELAVNPGQTLQLIAGTVVNTGKLLAPQGEILVATVPGETMIRVFQPGSVLNLEIPQPQDWPQERAETIATLPQLLTGGIGENASQVATRADGSLYLTGSGLTVETGDIAMAEAEVDTGQLLLLSQKNIALAESQLQSSQNMIVIATEQVKIRDSVDRPVSLQAGENLYIQGNQMIDIYAFQYPEYQPALSSGSNLFLVSDGLIAADAGFQTGGSFQVFNLMGQPGNFGSLPRDLDQTPVEQVTEGFTGDTLPSESF